MTAFICFLEDDNAPHFFVPRYITRVSELPLTPTGKVQKFKLRDTGITDDTWDRNSSSYEVRR